jgi:hypothetical protein
MRRLHRLQTPAAIVLAALLLAACGSSKGNTPSTGSSVASTQSSPEQTQSTNGGEVVARVGTTPITKAQVNHWMYARAATAYFRDSGVQSIPEGLLSDPPDYPRCVSTLEASAGKAPDKNIHESSVQLLTQCRELNQAYKVDATTYLVTTQQTIQIAKAMGATAAPSRVQALFQRIAAHEYPTPTRLHAYLTLHHQATADLLLEAEISVLAKQIYPRLATTQGRSRYLTLRAQAVAKTTCTPGYVVEGCKLFKGSKPYNTTPPAVLMEHLVLIS